MPFCSHCKHWEPIPQHTPEIGYCAKAGRGEFNNHMMLYEDGNAIVTGADFGCILFEAK